jgi:hypothetical protein
VLENPRKVSVGPWKVIPFDIVPVPVPVIPE